jgi:hypothetical protein
VLVLLPPSHLWETTSLTVQTDLPDQCWMEEEEESKQLSSLPAGLQLVHVPVVLPYPDQNCCWSWAFVAAVPRTKIDLNIIENGPAIICSSNHALQNSSPLY